MTVDYDNLWASAWAEMQDSGPVHRRVTEVLVRMCSTLPIQSVLDVGCGTGNNLQALQRGLGITDVVGVDISEAALAIARSRVQGEFFTMDVINDAPLDRKFDLVLSSQVLEHVVEDDVFLTKLHAMSGNYCLVGTMQGNMRKSESQIGHLRNYAKRDLLAKMEAAGFTVDDVVEWGFPFYSPIYRTLIEMVGGGHSLKVGQGLLERIVAPMLYRLYGLNSSRHGDVIMVLARPASAVLGKVA